MGDRLARNTAWLRSLGWDLPATRSAQSLYNIALTQVRRTHRGPVGHLPPQIRRDITLGRWRQRSVRRHRHIRQQRQRYQVERMVLGLPDYNLLYGLPS